MIKNDIWRKIVIILFCILLVVVDNTILQFFSIAGGTISLVFVFSISYSIILGEKEAVFIGVVTGLLQDIFFFNGIGINALTNLIICVIAAYVGKNIFRSKKVIPVLTCFGGYILKIILVGIILAFFNTRINIINSLISGVYNTIVMLLMYDIIFNFFDEDYGKSAWRFK